LIDLGLIPIYTEERQINFKRTFIVIPFQKRDDLFSRNTGSSRYWQILDLDLIITDEDEDWKKGNEICRINAKPS
jgi:hypothetical protein